MTRSFFLKIFLIHLFAKNLAFAANSSWAFQHIETEKALELARNAPSSNPIVAVIDTGVDLHHPALQNSLWTNPGEIPDNGIDDDGNGFIDDVHGWNFVTNSNDLSDQEGHGTHIAGLIAAQSPQFQGVAPQSRLMILKYYDSSLSAVANLKNEVRAFRYAIQMKAQIINFSGGGAGANEDEKNAIHLAEQKKILVVAAAGNEGVDSDILPYYPADYGLKNILSVTATDPLRKLPSFANYGSTTTHIAAPGEHILSTAKGGGYIQLSGTSQATALASGLAALLLSQAPLSPQQLIEKIKAGSQFESTLLGRSAQPGILNAYRSLAMKNSEEPAVALGLPLHMEKSLRYRVSFE